MPVSLEARVARRVTTALFVAMAIFTVLAAPPAAHARSAAHIEGVQKTAVTAKKAQDAPKKPMVLAMASPKKARNIALKDAGFKKRQVKKLKVKKGQRNGQEAYVVKFNFRNMLYTYAIAKWGGNVISRSALMAR